MTQQPTLWQPDSPRLQREAAAKRRLAAHETIADYLRSLTGDLAVHVVALRLAITEPISDDRRDTLAGFADQLNKAAQYAAKLAADYRSKTQ